MIKDHTICTTCKTTLTDNDDTIGGSCIECIEYENETGKQRPVTFPTISIARQAEPIQPMMLNPPITTYPDKETEDHNNQIMTEKTYYQEMKSKMSKNHTELPEVFRRQAWRLWAEARQHRSVELLCREKEIDITNEIQQIEDAVLKILNKEKSNNPSGR